jgi:hypothetical protein
MAVSVSSSGTQLTVITTEHTLKADTAAGCYELHVDMNVNAAGDTTEIRLKENVLAAGTVRSVAYATYTNAVAEPTIKVLGPIACDQGVTATIKQTVGVARSFPWKLLRVP